MTVEETQAWVDEKMPQLKLTALPSPTDPAKAILFGKIVFECGTGGGKDRTEDRLREVYGEVIFAAEDAMRSMNRR